MQLLVFLSFSIFSHSGDFTCKLTQSSLKTDLSCLLSSCNTISFAQFTILVAFLIKRTWPFISLFNRSWYCFGKNFNNGPSTLVLRDQSNFLDQINCSTQKYRFTQNTKKTDLNLLAYSLHHYNSTLSSNIQHYYQSIGHSRLQDLITRTLLKLTNILILFSPKNRDENLLIWK